MKLSHTAAHLSLLVALSLFLGAPLFVLGIPDLTHDGLTHAHWQRSFAEQFWHGELYPRWLPDHNVGLGSPTYFFYPPVPSYASAVFFPVLHARDPDGWLQAGYGCGLALVLSAIAAYWWLRSLTSASGALLGAAIYLIAPYHVATDLYLRGASAELWGFVWLPCLMLFVNQLRFRTGPAFLGLAVSFAIMVMTHLPTVVCFSCAVPAWALWMAEPGKRLRAAALTLGAMALGAGLSAVYLAPALLDQSKAKIPTLVAGFYDYRRYWLFHRLSWPPNFDSFLLLADLSTLLVIGAISWLCLRNKTTPKLRQVVVFYLALAVFGLFFMTQLSDPIWRIVPFLREILPWRFSTLLVVSAAALSALGFSEIRRYGNRRVAIGLALLVAGWLGMHALAVRRSYSEFLGRRDTSNRELVKLRVDLCEFWPATAIRDKKCVEIVSDRLQLLTALLKERPAQSLVLTNIGTGMPTGRAAVLDWRPRRVELDVDAPVPSRLTIAHFFYPDWQAHIEGSLAPIPTVPTNPEGLLQLEIPSGHYKVAIVLGRDRAERLGIFVSLGCGLFLLATLCVPAFWRKTRTTESDAAGTVSS